MPEIPASAIEAAAKAFEAEVGRISGSLIYAENPEQDLPKKFAEVALRAAFDELGMVKREMNGKQKAMEFVDSGEQPVWCLQSRWMKSIDPTAGPQ